MFKKIVNNLTMPFIGVVIGIISVVLVSCGNPANMGFCIACFLRDTVGAIGLQTRIQYVRPEVIGVIIGGLIASLFLKEWKPKSGSAPLVRFVLGACVMIGALIFLGCPLRMILRIGGGDLNAIIGLLGFLTGIAMGVFFLKKGFTLPSAVQTSTFEGLILPVLSLLLLFALIFFPVILSFSSTGVGSMKAPVIIALISGLVIGAIGYIKRICFSGGIRDVYLFRNYSMLYVMIAIIVTVTVGNLITGNFNFGFEGQPVAHTEWLWNFLGLMVVGLGSILLSGCPFRQLVLAGSGNTDSAFAIFGMMFGATIAHNLGAAASGAGVTINGKIGFGIAIIVTLGIGVYYTYGKKE